MTVTLVMLGLFQSTPARGGRLCAIASITASSKFQSTPARGGRREESMRLGLRRCFNPRPRAAGDEVAAKTAALAVVSIHARARRATTTIRGNECLILFQSTPARGGRQHQRLLDTDARCFNPRPRAAGDR